MTWGRAALIKLLEAYVHSRAITEPWSGSQGPLTTRPKLVIAREWTYASSSLIRAARPHVILTGLPAISL